MKFTANRSSTSCKVKHFTINAHCGPQKHSRKYGSQFHKHTKFNTMLHTSVKSIIFIILSFNCEIAIESFVSGHSLTLIPINVGHRPREGAVHHYAFT